MELDILMVIAEIAVALAGFAAVVANFSENWTQAKSEQLANLLTQSGIALFASMVPLIMSQVRDDGEAGIDTVWLVSSASYVFFATSYLGVSLFLSRGRGTGARAVDRVFLLTFFVAISAQIYNLYIGAQGWVYLLALLLSLAYAFVSFTLLIRPLVTNSD